VGDALRANRALISYVAGGAGQEGAVVSSANAADFARVSQVVNGLNNASGGLATLESGLWRLDGSFMLPENGGSGLEIGYVSRDVSGADGVFAQQPSLEIRFLTARDLPGISLVFDHNMSGAPALVQFQCFAANGTVVRDQLVVASPLNGALHFIGIGAVRGVFRVVLRVLRTAEPFRRARIVQVNFAPMMVFDGEDIISINTVHEADVEGRGLPANRIKLRIANKSRFSVLDGGGDLALLKQGCVLQYALGVRQTQTAKGLLWRHYADYYLDKWKVSEDFVELTGYSKAKLLDGAMFMNSRFALEHMGDLARRIADEAGIEVIVPHVMNTYPRFPGFVGNVSHREALAYLAKLASCTIFEDRQGRVHFVDLDSIHQGELMSAIDFEESFGLPEISQTSYINGIALSEHMISLDMGVLANIEVDVLGSLDVTIPYDAPIWGDGSVTVRSGFSISNIRRHPMYMEARVTGNGRCLIEVRGWRVSFLTTQTFYPAPWKQAHEEERPYAVNLPMFISNIVHIQSVRDWFLSRKFRLLERLILCRVRWRQSPERELGENAMVQVDKNGRMVRQRALKHEMEFNRGVLRGSSEGVVVE